MKVLITSPCSASVIIQYGIKSWPIWECDPSKFQWNYDDKEICLIIEGQARVIKQKVTLMIQSWRSSQVSSWALPRKVSNQKY